MIYSNKELKVEERQLKSGIVVNGVVIGEFGRGRKEVFIPTPKDVECIEGTVNNLSVGKTKTGRPRINRGNDGLYLILSSEYRYTRRGCGYIRALKTRPVEVIAKGNGADGDAGRIGTWDAIVVKAADGCVLRVTWGGYGYGKEATYYAVINGRVVVFDQSEAEDTYEALGLEMPFSLKYDEDGDLTFVRDEWESCKERREA